MASKDEPDQRPNAATVCGVGAPHVGKHGTDGPDGAKHRHALASGYREGAIGALPCTRFMPTVEHHCCRTTAAADGMDAMAASSCGSGAGTQTPGTDIRHARKLGDLVTERTSETHDTVRGALQPEPCTGDRQPCVAAGAGILCFAVAPHTGEVFFLLGKESGGAGDARLDCEMPPPTACFRIPEAMPNATTHTVDPTDTSTMPIGPGPTSTAQIQGLNDTRTRCTPYLKCSCHCCCPFDRDTTADVPSDGDDTSDDMYTDSSSSSSSSSNSGDGAPVDDDDDNDSASNGDSDSDGAGMDIAACDNVHYSGDFAQTRGDPHTEASKEHSACVCHGVARYRATTSTVCESTTSVGAHIGNERLESAGERTCCTQARESHDGERTHTAAGADGREDGDARHGRCRMRGRRGAGKRIHYWSDFGGRIEAGESEEQAAAREFFEETLGLVCTDTCRGSDHAHVVRGNVDVGARNGADHTDADRNALAQDLAEGRYAFKIRSCLDHRADTGGVRRRHHVTFVKQIPWTPNVVIEFAQLRSDLAALRRYQRGVAGADLESPKSVPAASGGDDTNDIRAGTAERAMQRNARLWWMGPHACKTTLAPDGTVRGEYVEKDYIQFWGVRRLRQALDGGGCFRREHLRPLFMPIVAAILDAMSPLFITEIAYTPPDDAHCGAEERTREPAVRITLKVPVAFPRKSLEQPGGSSALVCSSGSPDRFGASWPPKHGNGRQEDTCVMPSRCPFHGTSTMNRRRPQQQTTLYTIHCLASRRGCWPTRRRAPVRIIQDDARDDQDGAQMWAHPLHHPPPRAVHASGVL